MKTILVLDDKPFLLTLMRCVLKQYTVIEAPTAEEAFRRFHDNRSSIGRLIADVTLPMSSGTQVAVFFRQKNPALSVILTSGYPVSGWSERDAADLKRLRSDSVIILQKPFQAQVLLDAVRKSIGAPEVEKAMTAQPKGE